MRRKDDPEYSVRSVGIMGAAVGGPAAAVRPEKTFKFRSARNAGDSDVSAVLDRNMVDIDENNIFFFSARKSGIGQKTVLVGQTQERSAPESGADQRDQFYGVLADTLEDGITFQVVQGLHENLTAQLADRKPSAAPLEVSRGEIAGLLGASEKEQKAFDEAYLEQFGAVGIKATTVVEPKKFVIETENATIQVDPSRSDLVEMKRIDGRRYVLVAVEGEATVNGVEVNIP